GRGFLSGFFSAFAPPPNGKKRRKPLAASALGAAAALDVAGAALPPLALPNIGRLTSPVDRAADDALAVGAGFAPPKVELLDGGALPPGLKGEALVPVERLSSFFSSFAPGRKLDKKPPTADLSPLAGFATLVRREAMPPNPPPLDA